MNPKIINLLIIGLIPVLCLSQTILFENIHPRDDENNLEFLESTEFLCKISNSTKSLNLNYTGLGNLPDNFIDRLPINCINLQGNQLRYISLSFFPNFPNLTFLNLAYNYISIENLFSIGPHNKLETLILDNNADSEYHLQSSLSNIYRFENLKKLYLRNNKIKSFDSGFREHNFPKLTNLYLSGNSEKTGSLQNSLVNIPKNLLHLEIEDNALCHFNGTNFKNLTSLHIGGNQFSILGTSGTAFLKVENMPNLKELSSSRCKIRTINNNAFDGTQNLEKLNLSVNLIDKIFEGTLKKMKNLKVVSLNYNRFYDIPKELSLPTLKELYLNFNSIRKIEKNALSDAVNLEKLSLKGNDIKTIEENAFANLVKLTDLNLRENEISKFYPNWGMQLKNLQTLNLISNDILFTDSFNFENSTVKNVFLGSQNLVRITFGKVRKNLILHVNVNETLERSTNYHYRYTNDYTIQCNK
ncbi:protein phosphatase 1 regulatory subunit SDS22-like [Leptopilina heterotoma]|uniref:protein phosphatase 1 regulatory subunit SDS22-like n=1 Tax=Leptopilina heterotoma TaxID=63436 RepID=UPI001CA7CCC0|nr:protein phosphatase 1 regulatory subunit SDS22-like [Leptopilina heterotoma]